jgi:hypothetical protein
MGRLFIVSGFFFIFFIVIKSLIYVYLHYNSPFGASAAWGPSVRKHEGKERCYHRCFARPHDKLVYRRTLLGVQDGTHEILHEAYLRVAQHEVVNELKHQVPRVIAQLPRSSSCLGRIGRCQQKLGIAQQNKISPLVIYLE